MNMMPLSSNSFKSHLEEIISSTNYLSADLATLAWIQAAKSIATKARENINNPKPPSAKNPPLGISKIGLSDWWRPFCKKYSSLWKNRESIEDQWAIAVAIWRNYATKRNIPPFDGATNAFNVHKDTQDYMLNRFHVARVANVKSFMKLIKAAQKEEVPPIKRVFKEIIWTVNESRGFYEIETAIRFNTPNDICIKSPKLRTFLKAQGFTVSNSVFTKNGTNGTNLKVKSVNKNGKEQLYIIAQMNFSEQHLRLALGVHTDVLPKNMRTLIGRLIKSLMKEVPMIQKKG